MKPMNYNLISLNCSYLFLIKVFSEKVALLLKYEQIKLPLIALNKYLLNIKS
jgi:hypothetical protein